MYQTLTRDARHRPGIIRLKDLLQDEGYDRQLDDTSHRGGRERAFDSESQYSGDNRVEDDEGKC